VEEISDLPSNRKLILIKNEENYGFAEGNNIGMRYALKALNLDYVLLLNNDTVVDKAFLSELINVAESDEWIGIVGPKIYYYDYKGRSDVINFTGADLNLRKLKEYRYGCGEIDKGQLDKGREIDKIEGSAMLLKRKVLQETGLFDPDYFTYWEETDLCFRAAKKGFKSLYAPRAKIWHKQAASTGGTLSSHYIYYITRNQFLFLKKNATKLQLLLFLLYFFGFQFWFTSGVYLVYHRDIKTFKSFLKGVIGGIMMFQR
jgi:GT2 family glycosyltransferase